jgi:hypothetical protein
MPHENPKRSPARRSVGQRVHGGERDLPTWPEFVFVTAQNGSGCVPARHLSAEVGEAQCRPPRTKTTVSYPPGFGEVLEVLEETRRAIGS